MKAISNVFESILTDDSPVIWSPEDEGPLSAGPRIPTIWGWNGG
jgi:hypothetical protein